VKGVTENNIIETTYEDIIREYNKKMKIKELK
jgi:hypothetical protein